MLDPPGVLDSRVTERGLSRERNDSHMTHDIRLLSIVTRMNVGGPAMQISTLMRGLAGSDIYQVLLTGNVLEDEIDYLDIDGADLRFHRVAPLQRSISPLRDAQALLQIARFIHDFKPDVIHTHTAKAGVLGRVAAKLTRSKARRVHTFHGHLLHGYFSETATREIIRVERSLARSTHRLIAVGDQVRDDLLAVGVGKREQFRTVPPGVDLGPVPTRDEARESLGIPAGVPVVCFIGRLTPIKRIDRLADVIRQASAKVPGIEFVIAGHGLDFEILQKLKEHENQRIHLLGWYQDVARVLAASDLLLLTSDNEGTPVSIIQAMHAGVPAISTDVGSVRSLIRHGETGLLTETDPSALADAISLLLSDDSLRWRLSNRGREIATAEFGASALTRAHQTIYRELVTPE